MVYVSSSFRRGVNEIFALVRYYAALPVNTCGELSTVSYERDALS
jgi:hypothetical protein